LETTTFEKVDEILFVASLKLPEDLGFAFHTRKRALGVDGFIRRADDFTGIDELFNTMGAPAGDSGAGEDGRIELHRQIEHAVNEAAVKVYVCGDAFIDAALFGDDLRREPCDAHV